MHKLLQAANSHLPRLWHWILIAIALGVTVAIVAPQQVEVMLYKIALVSLSAVIGYWIDRSLFPYARPNFFERDDAHPGSDYHLLAGDVLFAASMLRRAIVIFAVVVGVCAGL